MSALTRRAQSRMVLAGANVGYALFPVVHAAHQRSFFTYTAVNWAADAGAATPSSSGAPITGAVPPLNMEKQVAAAAAAGGPTSADASAASSADSALDVAMRVNKLKRAHQQSGASKKAIEGEAWLALNSLTEDQINTSEGKAVALLLNSWAYFAKFWEKGKDGP